MKLKNVMWAMFDFDCACLNLVVGLSDDNNHPGFSFTLAAICFVAGIMQITLGLKQK